jgi:hypothetical protein
LASPLLPGHGRVQLLAKLTGVSARIARGCSSWGGLLAALQPLRQPNEPKMIVTRHNIRLLRGLLEARYPGASPTLMRDGLAEVSLVDLLTASDHCSLDSLDTDALDLSIDVAIKPRSVGKRVEASACAWVNMK